MRQSKRNGLTLGVVLAGIACVVAAYVLRSPEDVSAGTAALVSICEIQGSGLISPFVGETVESRGVVYADFDDTSKRGFFMQAADCDVNPETSDGIFVYLGEREEVVSPGDLVEVAGLVQEYFGMTEINTSPGNVSLISSGNVIPPPVDLAPPFDRNDASIYYESLEGMHVALSEAAVVGPTGNADETWVVRADLGIARVFQDDPLGTGEVVCVDDGGLFEISPEAKVGDHVLDLEGVIEYSFGIYRTQLITAPVLVVGIVPSQTPPEQGRREARHLDSFDFSVATFNLENLFDTFDDPATEDTVLSTAEYQRRLRKRALAIHWQLEEPALLAIQEAENLAVLQDLVAHPEIEAEYGIVWEDGPDFRGIDIGLLYRTDQVELMDYQQRQMCTTLIDGLGPDGNRDEKNPENAVTCDCDGDGELDGNRLFSRPPLIVRLRVCPAGCQAKDVGEDEPFELKLILNHMKSKLQDTATIQYTLPRRIEQAQFVAGLVQEIRSSGANPHLIVLGDLNDYPESEPLSILKGAGLRDLTSDIPKPLRYTFIHQGVSEVLDYVLVSPSPGLVPATIRPVHINADYPAVFAGVAESLYRCSDHDLLVASFTKLYYFTYLPLVSHR